MGETQGFNPEMSGYNTAELAKNPLGASDAVQELMRAGKYEDAQTLLDAVVDAQQGKRNDDDEEEVPRQAMAA